MTCHDAREQFSAWVDKALGVEARAGLEAHLAGCADCRRELERFQQTVALLHAVEPARAPAGFVDRVLQAARPVPWRRRLLGRLLAPLPMPVPVGAAAALLVAVAAVYLVERTPDLQQAASPTASYPVGGRAAPRPEPSAPPAVTTGPVPAPAPAPRKKAATAKREADRPVAKDARVAESTTAVGSAETKPAEAPGAKAPAGAAAPAEGRASGLAARQEARPDAPEEKEQARGAPPVPSVHRFAARALVTVDVAGRLAARDREATRRALSDLVARLEGRELARRPDPTLPGAELVEIVIPRAAYAEFTAGLAGLGQWTPEREVFESPTDVRIVVRLTD